MAAEFPNIEWSLAAWRDLDQTLTYMEESSPAAARRLSGQVLQTLQMLSDHPEAGPVVQEPGGRRTFRRVVIGRYLLFCLVRDQNILLVRFWDARRCPTDLVLGQD